MNAGSSNERRDAREAEVRPTETCLARVAPRVRRRLVGVGLTVGLLTLAGCSAAEMGELKRLGLPTSASDRAPYIHDLWIGTWIAALLVGLGVWGLIGWVSLRYRNRGGLLPRQNRYNLPLEIFYTMAPFIIIGVLFYHTIVAQDHVVAKVPEPDHQIDVVGQKWAWTFNYREAKNPAVGQDVWETGTISTYADLYLPVNKTVRFNQFSPDVNHSFWIPAFYYKLDVIPGRQNSWDVTPNKVGKFDGRCAELCGTYHSRMLFTVHVVPEAEYNAHLKQLAAVGQTGVAKGPAIPDSQGEAKEQDIPEVGNR